MDNIKILYDNIRYKSKKIQLNENPKNISIENINKKQNSKIFITFKEIKNLNNLSLNNINLFIEDKNDDNINLNIISLNLNNSSTNLNLKNLKQLKILKIKGNINNIENNLKNLSNDSNLLNLNNLKLCIISNNNNLLKINNLFENYSKIFDHIKNIELTIKSNIDLNSFMLIDVEILKKINKLKIINYNNINNDTLNNFISFIFINLSNLLSLNINNNYDIIFEDKFKNKLSVLNDTENLNLDYLKYNLNILEKIYTAVFDYNKNKKELTLYGESNLNFYNENYLKFIKELFQLNNNKLEKINLCNFDNEDIDFLIDVMNYCDNINKLNLENLNINGKFVELLKTKKFFNSSTLKINNILFMSEEAENNFYNLLNESENNINYLKLISLEDINRFEGILKKINKIELKEIYELNYKLLNNILDKNIKIIVLNKLNINELEDLDIIINILDKNKLHLKKIKIKNDNSFVSIFNKLKEKNIKFENLETLILNIENYNEEDKIDFILSQTQNFPNIKNLNLELLFLSEKINKKIFINYPKLINLN